MTYKLEHGSYYLYDDAGALQSMSDEVAVVVDAGEGPALLIMFGRPEFVEEQYNGMCRESADTCKTYIYMRGKFDVAELNKLINSATYAETFTKNFLELFKE